MPSLKHFIKYNKSPKSGVTNLSFNESYFWVMQNILSHSTHPTPDMLPSSVLETEHRLGKAQKQSYQLSSIEKEEEKKHRADIFVIISWI